MTHKEMYFKTLWFLVAVLQLQQGYSENLIYYDIESIQVLFRHGDRTPRKQELYPKLPYNASVYDSIGLGQLNEIGRSRAYRMGTLLRNEYNNILDNFPRPGDVVATSTDVDRTKVTLQLVLAGLYPSQNNHANCIPVPMSYMPLIADMLLMPQPCSMYIDEFKKVRGSPEIKLQELRFRTLYNLIGEKTGFNMSVSPIIAVLNTYQLFESQKSMNIRNPQWATPLVQREMEEVAVFAYELLSYSTKLKRLSGGPIIKEFIDNLNLDGKRKNSPKLYLYSAHDLNVASFTKACGFSEPKIPSYGTMVVLEKLRDRFGVAFVRMRYWNGKTEKWSTYFIPGCGIICPAQKYVRLMQNVIPSDEELNCLWDSITKDKLRKYYKEKVSVNLFPIPSGRQA